MTTARWEIPTNWNWVTAAEVAIIIGGGTPSTKDDRNFAEPGEGIPWIGPADLTGYDGVYISRGRRDLTEQGLNASGATILPKGSVLFSSRAPIGYCAIAANDLSTNQGFKSWVTELGVLPEFVRSYLLSSVEYVDSLASGTTFREVSGKRVETVAFPLPPAAEQRRIVAKLDALTARIARARAELDRVPVLADNLRRSILTLAYSGGLIGGTKRLEMRCSDSQYPSEWKVRTLGEISEIQGGIQVGKKRLSGMPLIEVPYLRVANVQRGWLRLDEIKTLHVTAEEKQRLLLRDGDILMNEGGDRDKLGRGWIWREQVPVCIHQNHVFRIRLLDQNFPPEFISHFANEFGQQYFIDQGTQTTNLASISKTKVSALPIPIPPVEEAREIVSLIESAFARADRLEAEAARARKLLDRLEAAILAKAFRGELVPQDPNDEPASVLLERIRAARAAAPKAKRRRGQDPASPR